MKREIVSGILSLSLVAGGALAGVAVAGSTGAAKDGGSERESTRSALKTAGSSPHEVVSEDGVNRVFGGNRYETAAAVAQAYGWDGTNTIAVYIASGETYPDALGIGLSHWGDGPLLFVTRSTIPSATQKELARLQPCFIDVQGGVGAISDTVFDQLKEFADPSLCEALPEQP
ncbi:cell wall-binding repeat-containing protein [Ornithinimicrobium cavernae]|uniref:cell wall-binding repeat-containing protein n=1 Tax=Ornithinimicrobium cavernae TaxID=2666047 RepID=UPI000D688717|nr:cell wall-binding repeat-containing protein [Ornithinimicrobium cavernae]